MPIVSRSQPGDQIALPSKPCRGPARRSARRLRAWLAVGWLLLVGAAGGAERPAITAGTPGKQDLVVAEKGRTETVIVVAAGAGEWEKKAATDLARAIKLMTGAKPAIAATAESIEAALKAKTPVLLVGEEALKAAPALRQELAKVAKKNPLLRADAIVVKRESNRVLLAGSNDECWLYVNGVETAHRTLGSPMWWYNDYKFQWDVDLAGKLKPGMNTLALRIHNPHHFGGMFRRPFVYAAK